MKTPAKVKAAAQHIVEMYGDHIEHLGQYQGAEVFYYHYPEDITAGYCPVYLYKDGEVDELTGEIAYIVLGSFVKDVDEIDIE